MDRLFHYGDFAIWLLWIALAVAAAIWRWIKKRRAEVWPITTGRFEGKADNNEFSYSYSAEGEYYSGRYHKDFLTESARDEFEDRIKGQQVFVRYQGSNPQNSVIRESDNPQLLRI